MSLPTIESYLEHMDIEAIRAKVLNTPLKVHAVATPFWEGTDGSIFLQDIPTDELLSLEQLKKAPNGDTLYIGALLCKALTAKDHSGRLHRIFQDGDREHLVKLGTSILNPLLEEVQKFFGINQQAVQAAKNG